MKIMLIVFVVFHYDGGTASSTIPFASMALCEAARVKMDTANMRPDGFGRPTPFLCMRGAVLNPVLVEVRQ